MKLTHKIVGLAAATALVAGAGLAAVPAATAAAPAKAATGTTLISFDKKLAPIVAGIVPVAPAKKNKTNLTFPVADVTKNVITHTGGINLGEVAASNPVITITGTTASITMSIAGLPQAMEIFTIKNYKVTVNNKRMMERRGFLHLTTNPLVVEALNSQLPQPVFVADMGLGQIRTTINK